MEFQLIAVRAVGPIPVLGVVPVLCGDRRRQVDVEVVPGPDAYSNHYGTLFIYRLLGPIP